MLLAFVIRTTLLLPKYRKLIDSIFRMYCITILKHYIHIKSFLSVVIFVFIFLSVNSCSKKISVEQPIITLPSTSDTTSTPASAFDTTIILPAPDTIAIPPSTSDTGKTYLALGDSYTIGQSVLEAERFPNQTVQLLKNENIQISDPKIIAVTGWTTTNLINTLNLNPPQNDYSIVTLLIGVNNQYQHRSIDEYKTEFSLLLNRSIAYAANNKNHVIVLSIPDYSVTPFARNSDTAMISRQIDTFNLINKTISENAGVNYIDITPISREAANDAALIAIDGLHPSGKQYKRWAELLAAMIKNF